LSRILLIHWNEAEAEARAARLRAAGHDVVACWRPDSAAVKEARAEPPDLFVIDLGRLPSQGRDMATWLRQGKSTRHVPTLFVGGAPEKVERIHDVLPDAAHAEWRVIRSAVRAAIRNRPEAPVVPGMPGFYAKTPLVKKLGIRDSDTVALLGAPQDFDATLGALPDGVRIKRRATGTANLVLLFVRGQRELDKRFDVAVRTMEPRGSIWFVWPKKASGVPCDLTQADVRAYGLARDLVDYKVASIDDVWTGLRFTRRRTTRR